MLKQDQLQMEMKKTKLKKYLAKTLRAMKVIQQSFHRTKVKGPLMKRLRKIKKGRALKARMKVKTWGMKNMKDHPLSLSEAQDLELKLLYMLNLIRTFKKMQRILDPFKTKTQRKKSKRFLKMGVSSDHKKLIGNAQLVNTIEATSVVSWVICLFKNSFASFKLKILM